MQPQQPTLSERAARFAREALDPPPVPEKRVAWAGGPIVTSDRREALLKLLVRKAAQGVALTADQQRALDNLSREGLTDDQQRALDAMGKENSAQPPRGEGPKRGLGWPLALPHATFCVCVETSGRRLPYLADLPQQ